MNSLRTLSAIALARSLIVLLMLWQLATQYLQLPRYILPSPLAVGTIIVQQYSLLLSHTLPTMTETLLGFFLGVLFGCIAGALLAFFRPMRSWLLPILIISQVIPVFAIAPLLVIWLGYGISSKIAATMLIIFFPITSAFHDGLQQTKQHWLDLAHTLHATPWQLFRTIRLPAAMPKLASGIRIAAVSAPLGAIIGEWMGASKGLGYLMVTANAQMQIDLMFAALIFIIMLALVLYFSVDSLLRKIVWWADV